MENVHYQPELLPMQGSSYERLKEPRETTLTHSGVRISAAASAPQPRDHIVWSLFNAIYMNTFCLGFAALYFSVKARDRKVVGDLEGAREYGSTARCLNIVALCLSLVSAVIVIVLLSLGVLAVRQTLREEYGG
ncbi:hypothetical protein MATL_G00100200 [Megalops atlanticus]|uniref:Uncharacterized protein n=1 Tax=Megalops atlanticus TaxID=7932 RepID=A0A9D3Q3H6_MEGAT|nr:hypothetical protein MATL_G00100200 [Megalops atlanticus]